jgi:hypothetical protein
LAKQIAGDLTAMPARLSRGAHAAIAWLTRMRQSRRPGETLQALGKVAEDTQAAQFAVDRVVMQRDEFRQLAHLTASYDLDAADCGMQALTALAYAAPMLKEFVPRAMQVTHDRRGRTKAVTVHRKTLEETTAIYIAVLWLEAWGHLPKLKDLSAHAACAIAWQASGGRGGRSIGWIRHLREAHDAHRRGELTFAWRQLFSEPEAAPACTILSRKRSN